jgi:hypothetical protein
MGKLIRTGDYWVVAGMCLIVEMSGEYTILHVLYAV